MSQALYYYLALLRRSLVRHFFIQRPCAAKTILQFHQVYRVARLRCSPHWAKPSQLTANS